MVGAYARVRRVFASGQKFCAKAWTLGQVPSVNCNSVLFLGYGREKIKGWVALELKRFCLGGKVCAKAWTLGQVPSVSCNSMHFTSMVVDRERFNKISLPLGKCLDGPLLGIKDPTLSTSIKEKVESASFHSTGSGGTARVGGSGMEGTLPRTKQGATSDSP
jgi:hypothetical protein